jgi:hypothetical protein
MKHNEVIEKIKKILALAESTSGPEADLAFKRANELVVKYNISQRELDEAKTDSKIVEQIVPLDVVDAVEIQLANLLTSCFFTVSGFSKNIHSDDYQGKPQLFRIIGEHHNVVIATHVYYFLRRRFDDLWAKFKESTAAENTARESYMAGLCAGLCTKLLEQQAQMAGCEGALVVTHKKIEDEIKRIESWTDVPAEPIADKVSFEIGKKAGVTIEVHPAVENSAAKKAS